MLQEERELMQLEMCLLDNTAPSKRDISYMLQFMYVQKKWFFYQKEKNTLRKLIYNYNNYPTVLHRNTVLNRRRRLHSISPIQRLIYKKKQTRT